MVEFFKTKNFIILTTQDLEKKTNVAYVIITKVLLLLIY